MAEATEDSKGNNVPLEVKQSLKSVLISYPKSGGIPMGKLMTEYTSLIGNFLPWRELGFKDLYRFLLAIPDVCKMEFREDELDNRVFAVLDNKEFMPQTLQKMAKRGFGRGTKPRSPEEIMELKKGAKISNRNATMPILSVNSTGSGRGKIPGHMAQGTQTLRVGSRPIIALNCAGRGLMPDPVMPQPVAPPLHAFSPESLKHEEIMEALQRRLPTMPTNSGQLENRSVCILRHDRKPFSDLNEQDLRLVYSIFGPVACVRIWVDRNYAFLKFKYRDSTDRALHSNLEYKGVFLLCHPEAHRKNGYQVQKVKKEDAVEQLTKRAESEIKELRQQNTRTSDVKQHGKLANGWQSDSDGNRIQVAPPGGSLPIEHKTEKDAKREKTSYPVFGVDSGERNDVDSEGNDSSSLDEEESWDYDSKEALDESVEDGASSMLSTSPSKTSSLDEDDIEGCLAGFNIKESDFLNLFSLACEQEPRCATDLPDKIQFQVHSVVSASSFWIHLCDTDLEVLHNVESKIPQWSSKQLPARKGHLGAAKYESEWYRCRVLSVSTDGSELEVFFCDYGNSEMVDIKDFKYLNEDFWELPPQAIPVRLHALQTPDDDQVAQRGKAYLANCVDSHIVQATVVKEQLLNPNLCVISLVDLRTSADPSLLSIEEEMKQKGYLVPEAGDASLASRSSARPLGNSLFREGSGALIPVTVTMVQSVQLFYVVFSNDKDYPRFRNLCKNFEAKVKPDLKQLPGLMIGVQRERKEVKRAKVIEFAPNFEKSNKMRVLYVDTGVTGWANFDDIFELTPELEQLPLQARPCTLAGVATLDEKADRVLEREILDKGAHINVIGDELDGKLHVELFCGQESRSINVKLVEKRLCSLIQNLDEYRERTSAQATSMGSQSLSGPDPSITARSTTGSGKGKADTMASRALRSARSSSPAPSRDTTLEEFSLRETEETQQGRCDKVSRPSLGPPFGLSLGTAVQETKDSDESHSKTYQSTPKSTGNDVTCFSPPVSLQWQSASRDKSPVPCSESSKTCQTLDHSSSFDVDLLKGSSNWKKSSLKESLGVEEVEPEKTKESGEEDDELAEMRDYFRQLQQLLNEPDESINAFYRARRKEKLGLRVSIKKLKKELEEYNKEYAALEKQRETLLADA